MLHIPTKKGFVIQVITYENDGDNYSENNVYGLSEKNKDFLYKILKKIKYHQASPRYETVSEEILTDMLKDFPTETEEDLKLEIQEVFEDKIQDEDSSGFRYWIEENFLGAPSYEDYGEDYLRIIDSISIWYMEKPMELILTENF